MSMLEQDDYAFIVKDEKTEKLTFSAEGVELKMLIDSGATSNVMGENVREKLKAEKIKCYSYIPKEQKNLYAYSST